MKTTRTVLTSLAAALAVSAGLQGNAQAAPVVLDVNTATQSGSAFSLQEDGFLLSYTGSLSMFSSGANYCSPACPESGSRYLMAWGGSVKLQSASGALFSLSAFDGAETFMGMTTMWTQNIRVTGTKGSGASVQQDFALDFRQDGYGAAADFETFTLNAGFTDLASVTFSNYSLNSGYMYSLDNIVINGPPAANATTAVPEPGSLVLASLALVALSRFSGAGRRKTAP